eukprot:15363760-Ditylum_brightwellii.AAC.1
MHRTFHFEVTLMAPPETRCYIHIKPHKQVSWGFHAEDAWYVRTALQHYRCYTVVMKEKVAQWITDTVKFKHHGAKVPMVTPAERVAKVVKELTSAVQNEPTDGPPDYIEAVQRLQAVLLKEQQPTCDEPIKSGGKYNTPQQ